MAPFSFYPLQENEETKEPFLHLLPPHGHILFTPPRDSDAEALPDIMNDPRVYVNVSTPPYPYQLVHAKEFVERLKQGSTQVLQDMSGKEQKDLIEGFPTQAIREVQADGSELFIGVISVCRYRFVDILDSELRSTMIAANDARELGDPDIVWEIMDFLAPSHHGRGIMTTAVKTLWEEWMVPRMGARKIQVTTRKGNIGSVRVFEKNGFVMTGTVENCMPVQESKGGGVDGIHVLCKST